MTGAPEPIIQFEGLSKYFGGLKAAENISFLVQPGQIFAIIGPNGAGKTTIFNCVSGIYMPTKGTIRFGPHLLGGLKPHRVTGLGIARTFQNIRIFPEMSVLENVMVGGHLAYSYGIFQALVQPPGMKRKERANEEAALDWLRFVGIAHYADHLAKNLPYGSQRRLEIARALATKPRLLLLDEPAAGLNPQETMDLMQLIRKIRDRGLTILLIEHDMRVVMGISDRILVLDHGEAILEGTPAEVQANARVIEAYLGAKRS